MWTVVISARWSESSIVAVNSADAVALRERDKVIVNMLALMKLTHAAFPGMIDLGVGAVLNIGSIAGFQPMPGAAVYSATKAFVQTFSEAVHEELHGTGVSCTVSCPGPVPTE